MQVRSKCIRGQFLVGICHLYVCPQAIFIGHGPYFKKNYVAGGFENVQVYSLLCGKFVAAYGGASNSGRSYRFSKNAKKYV